MSHSPQTKAAALAMLLTGNSTRYVSEHTGVPLTTVKRWRSQEALPLLREIFAGTSLQRLFKNGPKK